MIHLDCHGRFYTSLGTTVTLTDGDYGWCMDQDATVVDLLNALESGYQGTMEPQYTYTAISREENDIGDTYVEICISQQVMWCYKDGVCIVYTPVVTGNPNKGNATPSNGVWSIEREDPRIIRWSAKDTAHRWISGCRSTETSESMTCRQEHILAAQSTSRTVRTAVSIRRMRMQRRFMRMSRSGHRLSCTTELKRTFANCFAACRSIRNPSS